MVAKVVALALLVAHVLGENATAPAADLCSADNNNGFELSECGNDKVKLCCHPKRQVCLSGTPKDKDEQFECSANRALYGMKIVTVFIIPICSLVFLLSVFIILLKQVKLLDVKPPLLWLCLAQVVFAMLVVFSPLWKFALYSAFVAVIVFSMGQVKGKKWVTGGIIVLQLFNLLATIGAYGTSGVFVPLGLLSEDNVKSWETGIIDMKMKMTGATCSGYYGNYFNVESVELNAEGADPEVKYSGYCSDDWMTTVGAVVMGKAVAQLFMLVLSLRLLVAELDGGEKLKSEV
jgi:hypothetical protein